MIINDRHRIFNADSTKFIKLLHDKSVVTVTDFPYGVGIDYDNYEDTRENLKILVDAIMPDILRVSRRALITCGQTQMWLYPEPDWVLNWYVPAGNGKNRWGFTTWQPILAYGKDPFLANNMGSRPDSIESTEASPKFDHPCPKPLKTWIKIIGRASVDDNDVIFDPFAGTFTTTVACMMMGKKSLCVEQSEKYYGIGVNRINEYLSKPMLLDEPMKPQYNKNEELFGE